MNTQQYKLLYMMRDTAVSKEESWRPRSCQEHRTPLLCAETMCASSNLQQRLLGDSSRELVFPQGRDPVHIADTSRCQRTHERQCLSHRYFGINKPPENSLHVHLAQCATLACTSAVEQRAKASKRRQTRRKFAIFAPKGGSSEISRFEIQSFFGELAFPLHVQLSL